MARKALSLGFMSALAALSLAAAPTAAVAQYYGHDHGRHNGWYKHGGRGGPYGSRGYGYYDSGYDRHRCRDGTGGAIIGAIAGGLLGNAVAGYGDRTAGTIIGGGVGALAGNAIARDC